MRTAKQAVEQASPWVLSRLESSLGGRPRLFMAIGAGVLVGMGIPSSLMAHGVARGLVGWNVGTLLFLVLAGVMIVKSSHDHMRQRALLQDMRQWVVLALVILSALVSLAAVVLELGVARAAKGWPEIAHVGLAILTIVTSWAFTQTMFAMHYAHDFYLGRSKSKPDGLVFPGTDEPDYFDFLYLAGVIGTSGQTADVSFATSAMRRTGLVHCVFAFVFNTAVLALTINIVASLL